MNGTKGFQKIKCLLLHEKIKCVKGDSLLEPTNLEQAKVTKTDFSTNQGHIHLLLLEEQILRNLSSVHKVKNFRLSKLSTAKFIKHGM